MQSSPLPQNLDDQEEFNFFQQLIFKDEEIIRMVVGGSAVAFTILAIAYFIYLTNLTVVLSFLRTRIMHLLMPKSSHLSSYIVYMIIYIQLGMFVMSCLFGRILFIQLFSIYGPDVSNGQIYRFFTSAFIHVDVLHLYNNLRSIAALGCLLIHIVGVPRFFIIFIFSNTIGGLISFYWQPLNCYFGASSVSFGIIGSLTYIYYFKAKLLKQDQDVDAELVFQNETTMFIVRYFIFGILLDRYEFLPSLCAVAGGFIACMALMRDFSKTKKQVVIGATVTLILALVLATQLRRIYNIDLELKKLEKCLAVGSTASDKFLQQDSIEVTDYYKKRNYAYEVQQYVVPAWKRCNDEANRISDFVLQNNVTLIPTQSSLLSSYSSIFNTSLHLWKEYSTVFQEETAEILVRDTQTKTNYFINLMKYYKTIQDAEWKIINDSRGVATWYTILQVTWTILLFATMFIILFVRSFPNSTPSQYVLDYWGRAVLTVAQLVK